MLHHAILLYGMADLALIGDTITGITVLSLMELAGGLLILDRCVTECVTCDLGRFLSSPQKIGAVGGAQLDNSQNSRIIKLENHRKSETWTESACLTRIARIVGNLRQKLKKWNATIGYRHPAARVARHHHHTTPVPVLTTGTWTPYSTGGPEPALQQAPTYPVYTGVGGSFLY